MREIKEVLDRFPIELKDAIIEFYDFLREEYIIKRAIKSLPEILKNKFQISIEEPLVRKFIKYNGEKEELNIYGKGKKEYEDISIIGEAKAKLSKRDVDRFIKKINRLESKGIIFGEKLLLLITYSVEPEIEEYAKTKGIEIIWSYML
ncbi:MAG: hypothetical protein ACP5OB_07015 [Candidatus Ratteibacteria bacterium]